MTRPIPALLLVLAFILGGCSSDTAVASGPCDLLREADAAELLGGPVEQIGYAEYVAANSPVPAGDQAKVDAAAKHICMYTGKEAGTAASLQLDSRTFKSADEFRRAFGTDVEHLDGVGLAANYQTGAGDRKETHLGVLLNDEGDFIALSVTGTVVTEEKVTKVASLAVDRY